MLCRLAAYEICCDIQTLKTVLKVAILLDGNTKIRVEIADIGLHLNLILVLALFSTVLSEPEFIFFTVKFQ